jgi:hypothetical protein
MFVARFGVAARANISVMAADVVSKEDAENGEQEPEEKTAQINILLHNRIPSSVAGRLSGDATLLPPPPRKSSYKMTAPFVIRINSDFLGSAVVSTAAFGVSPKASLVPDGRTV